MERNLLETFFKPESVAVVGASTREGSVGRILVDNLKQGGFPGRVYPMNPKATESLGARAYPSSWPSGIRGSDGRGDVLSGNHPMLA